MTYKFPWASTKVGSRLQEVSRNTLDRPPLCCRPLACPNKQGSYRSLRRNSGRRSRGLGLKEEFWLRRRCDVFEQGRSGPSAGRQGELPPRRPSPRRADPANRKQGAAPGRVLTRTLEGRAGAPVSGRLGCTSSQVGPGRLVFCFLRASALRPPSDDRPLGCRCCRVSAAPFPSASWVGLRRRGSAERTGGFGASMPPGCRTRFRSGVGACYRRRRGRSWPRAAPQTTLDIKVRP